MFNRLASLASNRCRESNQRIAGMMSERKTPIQMILDEERLSIYRHFQISERSCRYPRLAGYTIGDYLRWMNSPQ